MRRLLREYSPSLRSLSLYSGRWKPFTSLTVDSCGIAFGFFFNLLMCETLIGGDEVMTALKIN